MDGQFLITNESEIEQLTNEIEQHEHLMADSAIAEQLRMYLFIA